MRLAEACGVSEATISQLVRFGSLLKRDPKTLIADLTKAFIRAGADSATFKTALSNLTAPTDTQNNEEQIAMILRRQSLTRQARQTFGLIHDPFDDPQKPEQVRQYPGSIDKSDGRG